MTGAVSFFSVGLCINCKGTSHPKWQKLKVAVDGDGGQHIFFTNRSPTVTYPSYYSFQLFYSLNPTILGRPVAIESINHSASRIRIIPA